MRNQFISKKNKEDNVYSMKNCYSKFQISNSLLYNFYLHHKHVTEPLLNQFNIFLFTTKINKYHDVD